MQRIRAFKKKLGPLQTFSVNASDIEEAHARLGALLTDSICRALQKKIQKHSLKSFTFEIRLIRGIRDHVVSLSTDTSVSLSTRKILQSYLISLQAWTETAGIFSVELPQQKQIVDEIPVTPEELAWWLQNDNVGCQTGMLRTQNGANGEVLFWHSEEDTSGLVDMAGLVHFSLPQGNFHAFCYPFLLPGPAFGWNDSFFQAIDFLPVHLEKGKPGTLANIIAWIAFWFPRADLQTVIEECGPYFDGYAINHVWYKGQRNAYGEKTKFGGDTYIHFVLGKKEGDRLLEVNLVSKTNHRLAKKFQNIPKKNETLMRNRLARMNRFLDRKYEKFGEVQLNDIVQMLQSRQGKSYGYVNTSVVGYAYGVIKKGKMEICVGAGPALKDDSLFIWKNT